MKSFLEVTRLLKGVGGMARYQAQGCLTHRRAVGHREIHPARKCPQDKPSHSHETTHKELNTGNCIVLKLKKRISNCSYSMSSTRLQHTQKEKEERNLKQ